MNKRITIPLIKINSVLKETNFGEAFNLIFENLSRAGENETLLLSSGNYSNEVLYQLQKLSRTALKTNALSAFDYYNRGTDFFADKNDIVPFAEFYQANCFFCIFDINSDEETLKAVKEILHHCPEIPNYWFNTDGFLKISNYYAFFRSVNLYILQHNLEKGIYVDGLGKNYQEYKTNVLNDNLDNLISENNLKITDIKSFTELLLKTSNPVFIVWEKLFDEKAYHELENLCMLIEIQSKPAAGFLTIKGDLNSQGLFDIGFFSHIAPGGEKIDEKAVKKMSIIYESAVYTNEVDVVEHISKADFKNILLWNATNSKIDDSILNQVKKSEFAVLQTAFVPENAEDYDVILPANLPEEISGTYTDSAKIPHNFEIEDSKILKYNNLEQIAEIAKLFGKNYSTSKDEIFLEYISFMNAGCHSSRRHFFK